MIGHGSTENNVVGKSSGFDLLATPELSVLLPTYNRVDALSRTLLALEQQTATKTRYEIIVVDDGSNDDTDEVLRQFAEKTGTCFAYVLLQENGGPARARNEGLAKCRGSAVLIIGDDIEPSRDLVEKHLLFHHRKPEVEYALLGHVCFPEELRTNAFMRWLETDGRKYFFNYAELEPGKEAEPIFFYTCNVSVKMALLENSGWFDESFPYASHEDLELGYRLADKGMRLMYDPTAQGFHWHVLTIEGIARRVYLMGYSADIFWQKVGDKGSGIKRAARRIIAGICSLPMVIYLWNRLRKKEYSKEKSYPTQWHLLLFIGFFIGLSDALNKRRTRV
jgi:glycosyltransferase involved in cell wall biosynthesis